jgi:hypothetical protein
VDPYSVRATLISRRQDWAESVARSAERAGYESRRYIDDPRTPLEPWFIVSILSQIRDALGEYRLYGLAVPAEERRRELNAFAEHAAYSSRERALILMPDIPSDRTLVEIFDPAPVVKRMMSTPDMWPGVLFWIPTGQASFVPLEEAPKFFEDLLEATGPRTRGNAEQLLGDFNRYRGDAGVKRLLHLSDLHFGTPYALQNQAYLSSHLRTKAEQFHRVVITGDLTDNPARSDALAFSNFRADLEGFTGREPIVIPGNHDQRAAGNTFFGIGTKLKQVAKLEWSSVVVDDELQCVFLCFDTSLDASLAARGVITREQLIEVATVVETKLVNKPELRDYLSVALIHHHPYSFEAPAEPPFKRGSGCCVSLTSHSLRWRARPTSCAGALVAESP